MGSSVDARVFFGIPVDELVERFDEYHWDWEEEWKDIHGPKQPDDRSDCSTPEWDAWRAAYKEYNENGRSIDIVYYGWLDYDPQKAIAVTGSIRRIDAGDLVELDDVKKEINQEQLNALREFCEKFDIPYKEPKWYISAYYG